MLKRTAPLLGIAVWLAVKYGAGISDRYLPGLDSLSQAVQDLGWDLLAHTGATALRTVLGCVLGASLGILAALLAYRARGLEYLMPTVNALRAVPAVALVPFFLLWFGFSEAGRYLLVALAVGLNVMVACADTLLNARERDVIVFQSHLRERHTLIVSYWLPRLLESLLPTMRFGLSLALGAIVVAEMLGSQFGLGYLIQTSRSTFSINVIFLCSIILGAITITLDAGVRRIWKIFVTWR